MTWTDGLSAQSVRANEGETNPARIAHVPSLSSSHARADEGVPVLASGGIVRGREQVSLGRGESGPEQVLPLSWLERRSRESPEFTAWFDYESQLAFQQDYPDAFHDAVSAELVACTLGQRRPADRLELRVDLLGRVLHAAQVIRRSVTRARFILH